MSLNITLHAYRWHIAETLGNANGDGKFKMIDSFLWYNNNKFNTGDQGNSHGEFIFEWNSC